MRKIRFSGRSAFERAKNRRKRPPTSKVTASQRPSIDDWPPPSTGGQKASRGKGVKGAEPLEGPILPPWPSRTVLSHIGPKWPIWQEKVCSSSDMAVETPNGHMRPKLADIHAIWPVIWPLIRFNGHFWAHVRRTDRTALDHQSDGPDDHSIFVFSYP